MGFAVADFQRQNLVVVLVAEVMLKSKVPF